MDAQLANLRTEQRHTDTPRTQPGANIRFRLGHVLQAIKNVNSLTTIGVFYCLLVFFLPANVIAATETSHYFSSGIVPFEVRDQNVFNLVHGQALPTSASLIKKRQSRWSSSLIITNTLHIESNNNEHIFLDYENYRFNFSYQYGLFENWNLRIDIPLMHQRGGFFDSAIDNWHIFLDVPRANRPHVENDQYIIHYQVQDTHLIDLNESSTSFGDIQIAIAHSLVKDKQRSLSLWSSLKLPTGDKKKLSGSGATDFSAWLAFDQQLNQNWLMNINAGLVILGKNSFHHIALADSVFYGHIMLGWRASNNIKLKAQLQGHTSYYPQSQLKILGDSYFLTLGGSIKINQCNQLDLATSQDIDVGATPDVSILISWRSYMLGC